MVTEAKATDKYMFVSEGRELEDRRRLDTVVVQVVNDVILFWSKDNYSDFP